MTVFSWQSRGAMERLQEQTPEVMLAATRSVYLALCEMVGEAALRDLDDTDVETARIAARAGVGPGTATDCLKHLVEIGLLSAVPGDGEKHYALESWIA